MSSFSSSRGQAASPTASHNHPRFRDYKHFPYGQASDTDTCNWPHYLSWLDSESRKTKCYFKDDYTPEHQGFLAQDLIYRSNAPLLDMYGGFLSFHQLESTDEIALVHKIKTNRDTFENTQQTRVELMYSSLGTHARSKVAVAYDNITLEYFDKYKRMKNCLVSEFEDVVPILRSQITANYSQLSLPEYLITDSRSLHQALSLIADIESELRLLDEANPSLHQTPDQEKLSILMPRLCHTMFQKIYLDFVSGQKSGVHKSYADTIEELKNCFSLQALHEQKPYQHLKVGANIQSSTSSPALLLNKGAPASQFMAAAAYGIHPSQSSSSERVDSLEELKLQLRDKEKSKLRNQISSMSDRRRGDSRSPSRDRDRDRDRGRIPSRSPSQDRDRNSYRDRDRNRDRDRSRDRSPSADSRDDEKRYYKQKNQILNGSSIEELEAALNSKRGATSSSTKKN